MMSGPARAGGLQSWIGPLAPVDSALTSGTDSVAIWCFRRKNIWTNLLVHGALIHTQRETAVLTWGEQLTTEF